MNRNGKNYDDMTREELEQELREAFLDTDIIDDHLNNEMEKMRETLNQKWPIDYPYTPEESWERFLSDNAEELEPFLHPKSAAETNTPLSEDDWFDPEKSWQRFVESRGEELAEILETQFTDQKKPEARTHHVRPVPSLLRKVLIAAVIVVLLAGAALAADSLGLIAWVPKWNADAGRYEPAATETDGKPIPAALTELGITEPVYPAKLPEGFVITESHISEDPLLLVEQYARGKDRLSITVTSIKSVKSSIYQKSGTPMREYHSGKSEHYIFENEETITAVWYTKNYATVISANLPFEEVKRIIDSLYEQAEGGEQS